MPRYRIQNSGFIVQIPYIFCFFGVPIELITRIVLEVLQYRFRSGAKVVI